MRSFTSFLSTGLFIKGIIQDKNNVFLEAKGVAEEHCSELMPAVLMETGPAHPARSLQYTQLNGLWSPYLQKENRGLDLLK